MTGSADTPFYFHPQDPDFRADPYPHYKSLLDGPPRTFEVLYPTVLVARYADVRTVLRDHVRFSNVNPRTEPAADWYNYLFRASPTLVSSDPPTHTRLRRLVSAAFTPRVVRAWEPRIRGIVGGLLDSVATKGHLELMADLANPLPMLVISELLGVCSRDFEMLKSWTDAVVESDNRMLGRRLTAEIRRQIDDLHAYFLNEIRERKRNPRDDLVTLLSQVRDVEEGLTEDELIAFLALLLFAGSETTTNLLGNGILALCRNPQQFKLLKTKHALMPNAIEEMLRYDPPVQAALRYATAEVELGGTIIPREALVLALLGAANRDPAQFEQADSFDIERDSSDHLAFSDHIHYCLGAVLARMESSIAISSLLRRFPRLKLADAQAPVSYKGSYFFRGLSELRMTLD